MGKRGPKPQEGKREANGRLSRKYPETKKRLAMIADQDERAARKIGMEARERVHGLKAKDLLDQNAGSFVGRLHITGEISMQQCEAAKEYLRVYQDMQAAIGGPKPSGAVNLNATKGLPGPENVQRAMQAREDWEKALTALQNRQNELRGGASLIAALDYCVLRDGEYPHMVGWLREGLNALARHFKIGDKHKAAKEAA
jgi:hypothetical protein